MAGTPQGKLKSIIGQQFVCDNLLAQFAEIHFVGFGSDIESDTEQNVQIKMAHGGTVSKMVVHVINNSNTSNTVVTVRKNGESQPTTVTIPGSSTDDGETEISTTFATGDLMNLQMEEGGGGSMLYNVSIFIEWDV